MSARALLQHSTGLNISEAEAQRAVRARMAQLGVNDSHAYLRALGADEMSALTELVVVPESWLFRDAGAFRAAAGFVQRTLALHPARQLRILSLPCASGEEPYSMAMALDMAAVAPHLVRIDAIDLSQRTISRGIAGRYTRNAFRGDDLAFRDRYFSAAADETYQLCDAIRARVHFRQGNLFELDTAADAGRYDLVFCRNLLIYFDDPAAHAAAKVLHTLLADDGLLFTGYAEVPAFGRLGFAAVPIPGAFAMRKQATAPSALPASLLRRARALRLGPEAGAERAAAPTSAAPVAIPGCDSLAQARRLADRGDYAAAAAICHAWLATDPASADAFFILGLVSECQQQAQAAALHWRRCVYLQPGHYDALCHMALLAERSGDTRAADALWQRAARVHARQVRGGAQ